MAAVAQGLVLDSSPHFVQSGVNEFDDVERIRDLPRVGQRGVERGPVGARQVQHRPSNAGKPTRRLCEQPARRRFSGAATDYVQQLAPPDVDDVSGPGLGAVPAAAGEQGLVEPQRLHRAYPVCVRFQQR